LRTGVQIPPAPPLLNTNQFTGWYFFACCRVFVSGHGGDDLSTGVPAQSDGMLINGVRVKRGIAKVGSFGYSLLERVGNAENSAWTFSGFDYQGNLLLKCAIRGRDVICE